MTDLDPNQVQRLTAALCVLERTDPGLALRLTQPVATDHVSVDASGHVRRAWCGAWLDLDEHGVRLVAAAAPDAAREHGLWFGVGSGRALSESLTRGERHVLWEPDPWLLCQVLARHDFAPFLASGALVVKLGADLIEVARARPRGNFVVDVATAHMRAPERRLLDNGGRRPVALLVEGRLLIDALATALDRRDIDVYQVDIERLSRAELDHTLDVLRPTFALAINDTNGLAEWTSARGTPLLVWEIDPTTDTARPLDGPAPLAHVFTYRAAHVAGFQRAGWASAEVLPLAADPKVRRRRHLFGAERVRYSAPVAFVGASMARQSRLLLTRFMTRLAELRGADTAALEHDAAALERVLAAQAQDLDHYLVPELLEEHMRDALDLWHASGDLERPAALVGELSASQRRAAIVGTLSGRGMHVWGDSGWTELLAGLGADAQRVRYRGPAGNREEIERVYSGAIVNLDVGRLYQSDIVTLRVFDVLACGGLCLTEHNREVARLFDVGSELDTYATRAELVRKVDYYTAHPEVAREIGERGRRAIEERHALDLRLDHMLRRIAAPSRARAA